MHRSVSVPFGIMFRQFYCHKCGERLEKELRTRTLNRGDPDYKKHNRFGRKHIVAGTIRVSEYVFVCPHCGHTIGYSEQCVIEKIQKRLGEKQLTEGQIADERPFVEKRMSRAKTVRKVIFWIIVLLILYYQIKTGGRLTIYF